MNASCQRTLNRAVFLSAVAVGLCPYLVADGPLPERCASLDEPDSVRWYVVAQTDRIYRLGEVFGDPRDRLLRHATTVNIKGDSYRLREKKKTGPLGRKATVVEV